MSSASTSAPLQQRETATADSPQNSKAHVERFQFAEEPLGMPASQGCGWPQFEVGEDIGDDNRYTVMRKLSWGSYSSVWLVRDKLEGKFVCVKALTGYMTNLYNRGVVWEADALRLLNYSSASRPSSQHCIQLLDEFTVAGKGSAGEHLCFVTPVYGGDVKVLQNARSTRFPLPLAKRIALHLLRGVAHAHERGIVHTDLKHDNIFFTSGMTTEDIESWIAANPPQRHSPHASHDGMMQTTVTQRLPLISEDEALRATYLLADLGSAQPSNLHDDRTISCVELRPPEVYLGAKWDKPADIWAFGVLVYELALGKSLFIYKNMVQPAELTPEESMLYQMILYSHQDFQAAQLEVSPRAIDFFDPADCALKKKPKLYKWPIKKRIDEWEMLAEEDSSAMAQLIMRCIVLDPSDRASASDLLGDPWFDGVDSAVE